MKRQIIITEDGSPTLFVPELDEHYHSVYGAKQESMHVFINAGLNSHSGYELSVFEVGFGTGLNAILTLSEAIKQNKKITFHSIEKYPLDLQTVKALGFEKIFDESIFQLLMLIHKAPWETEIDISDNFKLKKIKADLKDHIFDSKYDVIYFDAFDPAKQPHLWENTIFDKIFKATNPGGVLTTYSAKGIVKRAMLAAGFSIEKIPGPPGKREMLRARKK